MNRFKTRRFMFVATTTAMVAMLAAGAFFLHTNSTFAASNASNTASYTGSHGSFGHLSSSTTVPKGVKPDLTFVACVNETDITGTDTSNCHTPDDNANAANASAQTAAAHNANHKPSKHKPAANAPFNKTDGSGHNAPKSAATSMVKQGNVITNFNGISDVDSHAVNGFHDTPPDQALCVGRASALQGAGVPLSVSGTTSVVVEGVNSAWSVYSTSGALLFGPDTLTDLFSDPGASGDIICNYDTATQTFTFGEIGELLSGPDAGQVGTDLAVLNKNGYAPYQIDTSFGGDCFPDFPHQGYDTNAWYLSINEFCGPNEDFAGAALWAISKSQLAAESANVNFVSFGPVSLDGNFVLAMQPAFGNQSGTEYLVNSFPFDENGNANNVSNSLGLWQVNGDKNVTKGSGTVTLQGRIISSETYGFPVDAASTGDGTTPPGASSVVISEPFLNPDDSRMEQVQLANTPKGLRLYTSLNSALAITGDPSARDGAAWFEIDPSAHKVTNQGYIGVAGTYLLYPSILRADSGTIVIDFSLTSKSINPSTGYVYMKSGAKSFSQVQFTGIGYAPHVSFADIVAGEPRWGDYSAAALDPKSGDIWVADEYIPPPPGGTDLVDNWGTRVWSVSPGN